MDNGTTLTRAILSMDAYYRKANGTLDINKFAGVAGLNPNELGTATLPRLNVTAAIILCRCVELE